MNFLDKLQENQEAAKSELASILNQKAFNLLDSYAAGPEIEVVTFSEDESSLTEEELESMTQEEFGSIDEGVGNLAGLSKHLLKTVTGSVYNGRAAGEHSEVETHQIKNKSAHRAVLNKALDDGHVPVVYVNGKIHSAGHSTGSSTGRPEFNIHDADKQKAQKETIYPKPRHYGDKTHYSEPYHTSNPRYSKGDALDQLTPGHEASFYKDNKVEVKVVKADEIRQKLHAGRSAAKPVMQSNYVKTKASDKNANSYLGGKTKTSETPAGDNLKAIKDAAALRLATKKLGGNSASAHKKAMDLHAELGKHLAAGNSRAARQTAEALADHVRNQGLSTHADKIADYAKSLKDLKSHYDKNYAKKHLANLRGETNESEELIEALESMLTEMLDVNEETLAEGITTGKTVWTSHTNKPLKGKIVSKDDDNKDHYIVKHADGNHSVHQDHIHFREEHAKYMCEAVVPGSVKKDKDGNVLTFKTVGDKNQEKEYDDSVKKNLEARKKHNFDFEKK